MLKFYFQSFLSLAFLLAVVAAQDSVQFFFSPVKDTCEWSPSNSFPATNNTANGGICAYIASKNRLYACPAPDPHCWSFNQNCKNGKDTPGTDQILCGVSNGNQWCCGSSETCTVTPGQINVCISEFDSPNKGVTPAEAQKKLYSDIPSSSILTTIPRATPSAFTTSGVGKGTSTESTTATGSSTSTSTTSSSTPTSPLSATDGRSSSSGGISGGAIAGIVVGVLGGLAIVVGAVVYFILRKRRQGDNTAAVEVPADESMTTYPNSAETAAAGYYGRNSVYAKVAQEPPHELPAPIPRQELP